MLILGGQGFNQHSTLEVTLQLWWITSDNVDPGGLIDTQLGRSLCNFAGITSDNVDAGGRGVNQHSTWEVTSATLLGLTLTMLILWGQLTINLGSHFATLLGLPLTILIRGGAGGSINTQLGKSLCNFAGITSDNVDAGGQSTQLGKLLCNFAGITSDNVDPRGVN